MSEKSEQIVKFYKKLNDLAYYLMKRTQGDAKFKA